MSHVSVTINSRQYRMACDDGQEHHLGRLAHDLDQRINHLRTTFGEIGDMRLTVMAALILADELAEARQRMRRVEEELSEMQQARLAVADRTAETQAALVAAVNTAAERIETAARLLGQAGERERVAIG
jgi:cell division protein ZapA